MPRSIASVLEADQAPAVALAPRDFRLALPGQHGDPSDERQAARDLARGVEPHVAVDDLDVIEAYARTKLFVQRVQREQVLADIGLGDAGAAIVVRDVRQHAG